MNQDEENAKNKSKIIPRAEVLDITQLDSDSAGPRRGDGPGIRGENQSEPGSRAINKRKSESITASATIDGEGSHPKKLIDRLELLEKAFNQYVGAHRDRLEKRLDENREFTQKFIEEFAAIKQEILEGSPQHHNE